MGFRHGVTGKESPTKLIAAVEQLRLIYVKQKMLMNQFYVVLMQKQLKTLVF